MSKESDFIKPEDIKKGKKKPGPNPDGKVKPDDEVEAEEAAADEEAEAGEARAEAKKGFDIDKALNTKGFAEFLAKYPDAEDMDMSNEKELENKFEVFSSLGVVKKELKDLYKNQIQEEMGIRLDNSDLASVDECLDGKAIEDPKEILDLRDQLKKFKDLPKQIKDIEDGLAVIGDVSELPEELQKLKNEKEMMDYIKDSVGPLAKTRVALKGAGWSALALFDSSGSSSIHSKENVIKYKTIKALEEEHGKVDSGKVEELSSAIGIKVSDIEGTLAAAENLEKTKAEAATALSGLKKELISGISKFTEVTTIIQAKAKKALEEMAQEGTITGYERAQETYEKWQKVSQESDTGINPLEQVDEGKVQEEIDAGIEGRMADEILEAIKKAKLGDNGLTRLEKSLDNFVKKEKIGSKEGDEARAFVRETLEEARKKLGKSNEDLAKKVILSRILIKIKQ